MAGLPNATFARLKSIILSEPHKVRLTCGRIALVDADDAELVEQYKWYRCGRYAATWKDGKTVLMHRLLMPGCRHLIDHEDGDGLNNQRYNLREATQAQNMQNRSRTCGSSRFKGVYWLVDRGLWRAQITAFGVKHHLGHFVSESKAARAYDRAAKELHGDFAKTNSDLGLY